MDWVIPLGLLAIALLAMTSTQSTSGDYVEREWRVG